MNINLVKFETSFGLVSQLTPCVGPEFVFAGRSNVGKSSLLNKIFNRKSLARVSGVPGKTATINFYRLGDVRFVDLPGYGYAKVAKGEKRRFSELLEGYFAQSRAVALVFLLLDSRHPPSGDDLQMVDFLIESELPFVVVLTKCDKLSNSQREARLAALPEELGCEGLTAIPFSAQTGEGVEAVWDIIREISEEENEV